MVDKISYALGLGIGQQIKSMNIENFCIEDFEVPADEDEGEN